MTRRRAILLVTLAMGGLTPPIAALPSNPFRISGQFWNRFGHDVKFDDPLEDRRYQETEIQAELKYLPSRRFQLVLGERVRNNEVRWQNAYVNLASDRLNLRLGNQTIRWGKSDTQSPLDNFNPQDLRNGISRSVLESKLPIPMANCELMTDFFTLQGVATAFFEPPRLDFQGNDWAYFGHLDKKFGTIPYREERLPRNFRNGAQGVRLSATLGSFDFSLSHFTGRSKLPVIRPLTLPPFLTLPKEVRLEDLVQLASATRQTIALGYDRESITGFEFETTAWGLGWRGDAAFVSSRTFTTMDLKAVRKPVAQYVLGIDYNGPHNSYVNLSGGQTIILEYDAKKPIAFNDRVMNDVSGEMSIELFNGNIKPGCRFSYNFNKGSYYANPRINFTYIQNMNLEIGMDLLGGPLDSLFGIFSDNDQYYTVLRVYF
jgi:hypothetical protein